LIKRFVVEEDGMEMVEWALVASMFALVAMFAWTQLANDLQFALGRIGTRIVDAAG
jgi:Flp pilus assembly pilin Flp